MCRLTRELNEKKAFGYKVVFVDSEDRKWSPAMGFCYEDLEGGKIPIIRKQIRLTTVFTDNILLYRSNGYEPLMVGRTSAFEKLRDAVMLRRDIHEREFSIKIDGQEKSTLHEFTPVIFRVELSEDLMIGTYGQANVVAGRRIRFLEKIEGVEVDLCLKS